MKGERGGNGKWRHVSTSSDNCFAFRLTAGRSALNMVEDACECKADDNGNGPRLNNARTATAVEAVAEVLCGILFEFIHVTCKGWF